MNEQSQQSENHQPPAESIIEKKRQRRYLRSILASIPVGVVIVDQELVIQAFNPAVEEITGLGAPQAVGRPCAELLNPAVAAALETTLSDDGEPVLNQQSTLASAGGQSIPISFSAASITDFDEAHIRGGIVILQDISKRVAHQQEIARERCYLSQVLEAIPCAVFAIDRDLTIQTFNHAAEAMTGLSASFAIGKPYQEIVKLDPESGSDPLPALLTAGGPPVTVRRRLIDVGGRKTHVRYSVAPLTGADERVIGGIAIFQDIGDIVAAERHQKEFVSMVSHELRTPLTSIKGFVTAVLNGRAGEINDRQRHFLSISREQSGLLLNLINDLLTLSRMDSGKMELEHAHICVADLAQKAAQTIVPLARRKEPTVEVEVAADLPSLWADEAKLFQVLQNLLSNAVKFTPLNGQITLDACQVSDAIVLSVSDSGIGIAPEDQSRIFERFYQVENIQPRQAGGTGLGLTIVKGIVERHGGHIEVESEQGKGTTFRVYLPIVSTPDTTIHTRSDVAPAASPAHAAKVPQKPKCFTPLILVVDDNAAVNELIQMSLEEEGYTVVTASSGRDALRLAVEKQPNLITLDVLMPHMNGFQVLVTLKDDPASADIPVCMVSIIEDKVKGYKLGAIDYVTKPFEKDQLLNAVNSILQPTPDREKMQVSVSGGGNIPTDLRGLQNSTLA